VLSIVYRVLQRRAVRGGVELHDTAVVGRRIRIPHAGAIVLHRYGVIGDDCMIRHNVTLGRARTGSGRHEDFPTLGRAVNVGVGAVVMGEIIVGDEARIGPNSLVTTDVPDGAMVISPRSRILKM
jgi:serine O-acetyltransferase